MSANNDANGGTAIVVMTANLWNGLAPDDRVVEAILASGADVIGLQELNNRQALAIQRSVREVYPWIATFGDSYEGRGVISRLPLASVRQVAILPDRPDVVAEVEAGNQVLTLLVGHPRPQILRRGRVRFQMSSLRQILKLGRLARDSAPAVLLGDFNMSPRHPGYRRLERLGLVDAYVAGGMRGGRTFPVRMRVMGSERDPQQGRIVPALPVKRFDHIWHTRAIRTDRAWIGPDTGSDHASVVARLILPPTGPAG